jgi:integrase
MLDPKTTEETKGKTYAKTDLRYWRDKVFQRTNDEFHVRIRFGGVQHRWPLKTANRDQAATKARDIYVSLIAHGYDATATKFKPWEVEVKDGPKCVTVGAFIEAVRAVAPVRPTTFTTYERKLRFLVSQVKSVKGSKKRFDYVNKGFKEWRKQVDSVPLEELTPEEVMKWRVRYVSEAGTDPIKANGARQTAASIIRNAKALFSSKLLRGLSLNLPTPLPFDGVDLGKRPRTRYKSKVDAPKLIQDAHDQLKKENPEVFKIFLLSMGAGLRRNEIDKLTWKQFDWDRQTLSIEPNEYGDVKTEASAETIDIGADMLAFFKQHFAKRTSDFVVSSAVVVDRPKHWNHYRCDHHFKELIDWLRKKEVDTRNPIHTLRKEFGSLVNQKFGLFAASAALRHSSIAVTREHYVDRKERIALNLTDLLPKKEEKKKHEAKPKKPKVKKAKETMNMAQAA